MRHRMDVNEKMPSNEWKEEERKAKRREKRQKKTEAEVKRNKLGRTEVDQSR